MKTAHAKAMCYAFAANVIIIAALAVALLKLFP